MAVNQRAINKFGRIGVLMGGPSTEREISLKSGKAVYEAIKQSGIEVTAIDIKTENIKENIDLINSHKINCAFLALHGRFGEDGQIQNILEILKIPYTGSGVLASKLAMDKIASRKIFEANGLTVPRYKVLDKYRTLPYATNNLGLPLVIKPATHGSSIGLSIIDKKEDFDEVVALAFTFDEKVIIEEYIKGRELTVGILNEKALPIIEILPKNMFFDYEAKYQPGITSYIVPAQLPGEIAEEIQAATLSAHKLLGCRGCSRVDMILDKNDNAYVLELNSIPGLTSTSLLPKAAKSAGIEFDELCIQLIKIAYEKTQT